MTIKAAATIASKTLLATVTAGLLGMSAVASADIFVDIPGIPGDSQDAQFRDTIRAIGATGTFNSGGCGVFTIVKNIDIASPRLISSVIGGRLEPEVDIIYTAPGSSGGQTEFYRMTLETVRIARLKSSTSDDPNALPTEQVNLRANSVTITHTALDAKGGAGIETSETVQCFGKKAR
jgi:type VI secretion system Hcp family effector